MLGRDLEFMPSGKYNNWCERRPLVADENAAFHPDKYVFDDSLSHSEKATYYVHELVGYQGLEEEGYRTNQQKTKRGRFIE